MNRCPGIYRAAAALVASLLAIPGCAPASRETSPSPPAIDFSLVKDVREDPSFNRVEELDQTFVLPPSWGERPGGPENLAGSYIAIVPDRKSPTGHRALFLGQVLTPQGLNAMIRKDSSGEVPRYQGKVESRFASRLSFLQGRMELRKDCLYEIEVVNARTAKSPTYSAFIDRKKMERAWSRLPKKYREILFVTVAADVRISAREYERCVAAISSPRLLRFEDDFFQAVSPPQIRRAIYLTALSEGPFFGDFDPGSGLYVKKAASKVSLKGREKKGTIVSFQSMKLLRKTLTVSGLSLPD